MTTGLAGGLTKPCKGILPAALTRIEDPPTAPLSLAAPKGAVFYALFYQLRPLMVVFFLVPIYRLTRKRVNQLFHRQLFILFVFSQLIANIFFNRPFISSYRIYIISSTPKLAIPISIFHICKLIKYHQWAFPFQISHELRNAIFGWYTHQHMNMIWTCLGFNYFYTLSLAENSQYLPNLIF